MKLKIGIILSLVFILSINSEVLSLNDSSNVELIDQLQVIEIDELGEKVKTTENFYKIKNKPEDISVKLEKIRIKFNKDQQDVFMKVDDNIKEYQNSRDKNIEFYTEKIDDLRIEISSNIFELNKQMFETQGTIKSLQENLNQENSRFEEIAKAAEEEYRAKLQKLQVRKYLLNALITQHCDSCDEIRNYQLDVHHAQNDKEILELNKKFLKQADDTEKLKVSNELKSTKELNLKYSELNSILEQRFEKYLMMNIIV